MVFGTGLQPLATHAGPSLSLMGENHLGFEGNKRLRVRWTFLHRRRLRGGRAKGVGQCASNRSFGENKKGCGRS